MKLMEFDGLHTTFIADQTTLTRKPSKGTNFDTLLLATV